MNDSSNIDDLLRQRLYATEVPPPAFVWPEVERSLRQRKRRFIFWIFGTAGMAGLVTLFLLWSAQQQDATHSWSVPADPKPKSEAAVQRPAPPVNTGADKHPAATPANPGNTSVSNNEAPLLKQAKTTTYTRPPEHQPAVAPSDNVFSSNLNQASIQTAEASGITLSASELSQAPAPETPAAPAVVEHVSALGGRLPASLVFNRPGPALPRARLPIRKKKEKQQCYDFVEHPNVWFLDAYAGPSVAKKLMQASPDDLPYLHRRLDSEQPQWAFNAGVRGSLLLRQHFLLRAGVHYDQMTEVFEYSNPLYAKYLIEVTVVNGQSQIDTLGIDFGEYYTKVYNRFGLLDIPLQAGIELRRGRSGFNINGGASVNVLFWKRGQILPAEGEPFPFSPADEDYTQVFRPRVGLSLVGSVQWFYHLQPRTRIFIEPYYRHILQPVSVGGHPIEVRYGIGGIKLGMTRILDF